MWSVPSLGAATLEEEAPTTSVAASVSDSLQTTPRSFSKDGRKIQVGDTALFQAGNAPPFIGIIRWFATNKEHYFKLCVNWLYRPADVKLAKGILLEAAPNEVFYSFHKDVIPVASLLHPCKVAFLRKGVELPSGISSFVCRRVYDIENKRLWWLSDRDYVNEGQEEVDQLLDKTRLEMHATVQPEGRSPKQINGSASAQQLRFGSESSTKGKKRDGADQIQGTESVKRERSTKPEDGEHVNSRIDIMVKAEISKITEKGGLTNSEGVEKLVHLMQLNKAERRIDLVGRVLLADVITATDRFDCLCRFVQLMGVPVLDEWLQEAHRGKSGDSSSPKESDKATEELLLALLRALDKLPINLHALETSNIGKSVNHLRSHKNLEIQKKARSLVDTWKKRVDAEIKVNEAKHVGHTQVVPWTGKTGFSEVSHPGNRRAGPTDATMKSSGTQPSPSRALPVKSSHADDVVKPIPVTPASLKLPSSLPASVASSSKDSPPKAAVLPQAMVKEEKSNSSSHSQNNSQSCSSDHARTTSSWKDDVRSSNSGSMKASKASGGSSRNWRSSNGILGTGSSGAQRETNLSKSRSLSRTTTLDKISHGGSACEKPLDMPVADQGNSQKLIVRLPNPSRNAGQSAGGVSFEYQSTNGVRSPGAPEKHANGDFRTKVRGDTSRSHAATEVSTDSWQSNDVKEKLVGCDESDRLATAIHNEEHNRNADETEKAADISRAACSSSANEKGNFLDESIARNSFNSMIALIESCAKYSESSAPSSSGDDNGMNLLASVAAGEMSKSDLVSPTGSPGSSPALEDPCKGNNEADSIDRTPGQCDGITDVGSEKQEVEIVVASDKKPIVPLLETVLTKEPSENHPVADTILNRTAKSCVKSEIRFEERAAKSCVKSEIRFEERVDRCVPFGGTPDDTKEEIKIDGASQGHDKQKTVGQAVDCLVDCKPKVRSSSVDGNTLVDCSHKNVEEGFNISNSLGDECHTISHDFSRKPEKTAVAELTSSPSLENEGPNVAISIVRQQTSVLKKHLEKEDDRDNDTGISSDADKADCLHNETKESTTLAPASTGGKDGTAFPSPANAGGVEILEKNEAFENHPTELADPNPPTPLAQLSDKCAKSIGSTSSPAIADVRDGVAFSVEASLVPAASEPDISVKLDFDLNDGIPGDESNHNEPANIAAPVCSTAVHLPGLPFASSLLSNGSPSLITVAAPAKGSFVPPENLSKGKAEPGWKGSAATSAFRPAEPRKVLEMLLSRSDIPSTSTATVKNGRPLLDIDLNEPGEQFPEDMASQSSTQTTGSESGVASNHDTPVRSVGGLDFDLNRVDEGTENGQVLGSSIRRLDVVPNATVKPTSGGIPCREANMFRDFDLNNGPALDEVGGESVPRGQHSKGNNTNVPFLPHLTGLKNNAEFGNMSSWFPPVNSYQAVAIPSFLPDRGEQPYPMVAAAGSQRFSGSGSGPGFFVPGIYRGPVLSSAPTMAFSPATAYPYPSFPFGPSFPVASTPTYVESSSAGGSCFPAIPSQLVGQPGAISSHYPRPYMLTIPDSSTSGGAESSRKWARQGLDLNAGPGSGDIDLKDERLLLASRQLSVPGSQAFVEEQARMYQIAGGGLKRKEPEGGWDAERFAYKQQWQ